MPSFTGTLSSWTWQEFVLYEFSTLEGEYSFNRKFLFLHLLLEPREVFKLEEEERKKDNWKQIQKHIHLYPCNVLSSLLQVQPQLSLNAKYKLAYVYNLLLKFAETRPFTVLAFKTCLHGFSGRCNCIRFTTFLATANAFQFGTFLHLNDKNC